MVSATQSGTSDAHDRAKNDLRESKQQREISESSHGSHVQRREAGGVIPGIGMECCMPEWSIVRM